MPPYQPQSATSMDLFGSFDMLQQPPFSPSALNLSNEPELHQDPSRRPPQSAETHVVALLEQLVGTLARLNSSFDDNSQRLEGKSDQHAALLEQALSLEKQLLGNLDRGLEQITTLSSLLASFDEISQRMDKQQLRYETIVKLWTKKLDERSNERYKRLEELVRGCLTKQEFDDLMKL